MNFSDVCMCCGLLVVPTFILVGPRRVCEMWASTVPWCNRLNSVIFHLETKKVSRSGSYNISELLLCSPICCLQKDCTAVKLQRLLMLYLLLLKLLKWAACRGGRKRCYLPALMSVRVYPCRGWSAGFPRDLKAETTSSNGIKRFTTKHNNRKIWTKRTYYRPNYF